MTSSKRRFDENGKRVEKKGIGTQAIAPKKHDARERAAQQLLATLHANDASINTYGALVRYYDSAQQRQRHEEHFRQQVVDASLNEGVFDVDLWRVGHAERILSWILFSQKRLLYFSTVVLCKNGLTKVV